MTYLLEYNPIQNNYHVDDARFCFKRNLEFHLQGKTLYWIVLAQGTPKEMTDLACALRAKNFNQIDIEK